MERVGSTAAIVQVLAAEQLLALDKVGTVGWTPDVAVNRAGARGVGSASDGTTLT
jgi:hypothetical protein